MKKGNDISGMSADQWAAEALAALMGKLFEQAAQELESMARELREQS